MGENYGFAAVNAYVYHSTRAFFFDIVIWCLGPVVDDSRDYPRYRIWLATLTCSLCRHVLRVED